MKIYYYACKSIESDCSSSSTEIASVAGCEFTPIVVKFVDCNDCGNGRRKFCCCCDGFARGRHFETFLDCKFDVVCEFEVVCET